MRLEKKNKMSSNQMEKFWLCLHLVASDKIWQLNYMDFWIIKLENSGNVLARIEWKWAWKVKCSHHEIVLIIATTLEDLKRVAGKGTCWKFLIYLHITQPYLKLHNFRIQTQSHSNEAVATIIFLLRYWFTSLSVLQERCQREKRNSNNCLFASNECKTSRYSWVC